MLASGSRIYVECGLLRRALSRHPSSHPEAMCMKVESQYMPGKQFMAHSAVEHAIRLMNLRRCKIDRHISLQFLGAKTLSQSCPLNHLDSPISKREKALLGGILLLRQSDLLNGCGVDKHCARVKRVNLH